MWLCEYDLSKECKGSKDCVLCMLEQVKGEIEEKIDKRYMTGASAIYEICAEIVDKYISKMK